MNVFENFKSLKADMEENNWVIEAFPFNYKSKDYIILAKIYQSNERKPKYALLETEILKSDNINDNLVIPVNSNGFMTDARTLREFFGIDYSESLGDILQQFNTYFSKFIPTQVNPDKSEILKRSMIYSLSKSDSEDPDKKYCFSIRRNHGNGKRTRFNDNKTRLLRSELYSKFKEEPTVIFCYSKNNEEEKSDEEIIHNFSKKL